MDRANKHLRLLTVPSVEETGIFWQVMSTFASNNQHLQIMIIELLIDYLNLLLLLLQGLLNLLDLFVLNGCVFSLK